MIRDLVCHPGPSLYFYLDYQKRKLFEDVINISGWEFIYNMILHQENKFFTILQYLFI